MWHSVTVAFSERRVSSRPSGRPTVTPRPITTTCAPAISTSNRRSRCTIPRGVHGSGAGSLSTSLPRFVGCRPSASFAGSMRSSAAFSSRCFGSGNCTMYPVHSGLAFNSSMVSSSSAWLMSAGRSRRIELIPTFAQSACLPRT